MSKAALTEKVELYKRQLDSAQQTLKKLTEKEQDGIHYAKTSAKLYEVQGKDIEALQTYCDELEAEKAKNNHSGGRTGPSPDEILKRNEKEMETMEEFEKTLTARLAELIDRLDAEEAEVKRLEQQCLDCEVQGKQVAKEASKVESGGNVAAPLSLIEQLKTELNQKHVDAAEKEASLMSRLSSQNAALSDELGLVRAEQSRLTDHLERLKKGGDGRRAQAATAVALAASLSRPTSESLSSSGLSEITVEEVSGPSPTLYQAEMNGTRSDTFRYTTLAELDSNLKKVLQEKTSKLPELPPKAGLLGNKRDAPAMLKRRLAITEYLNTIVTVFMNNGEKQALGLFFQFLGFNVIVTHSVSLS
eukprot:NODE_777_length_1350_cov_20.753267_g588_i0.p1 GENE.NODE_777_length_1350_cov_20.753267_g588_i0~~NODE_777_length_1350_cov_20.753267_g588_i0.p1  ORF type:complete len:361 (+),score=79.80 NODE_777_length_1350_cov_20.753267_g588_i0:77-1159(+)